MPIPRNELKKNLSLYEEYQSESDSKSESEDSEEDGAWGGSPTH